MSEAQLQRDVVKILRSMGVLFCHPMQNPRNRVHGHNLKALGMSKGVPDLLVFEDWVHRDDEAMGWIRGHGIAIELKHGKGDTSKEQDVWLEELRARGWLCAVCRTMDEVRDVLRHCRPRNGRQLR